MMAFELYHRNFYQHIVGWPHPFHGCGITIFRRTSNALWSVFTLISHHTDFPSRNDFTANEAITFLIQ